MHVNKLHSIVDRIDRDQQLYIRVMYRSIKLNVKINQQ